MGGLGWVCGAMAWGCAAEVGGIHAKTLHQMFGPKGNPTAEKLFAILACLQENEGVRLRVVA